MLGTYEPWKLSPTVKLLSISALGYKGEQIIACEWIPGENRI